MARSDSPRRSGSNFFAGRKRKSVPLPPCGGGLGAGVPVRRTIGTKLSTPLPSPPPQVGRERRGRATVFESTTEKKLPDARIPEDVSRRIGDAGAAKLQHDAV